MTGIQRLLGFARSPHHAWLAALTLGLGLAAASVPGIIAGAAAYALGWVFLPDSPLFRRWLAARESQSGARGTAEFLRQRAGAYAALSPEGKHCYDVLAAAIEEIRAGLGEQDLGQAGLLGQLAWTYLRLRLSAETLETFCQEESSAQVEDRIEEARRELAGTESQAREAVAEGRAADAGGLERLAQSQRGRLETLERRWERVRQAEHDLTLSHAEIERVHETARLARADLVTRKDPEALGAEIDRNAAHFRRTQDWLRDLEFDRTPADIPDEVTAAAPLRVAG